jgi:glycine hydroxymethyltransferase
MMFVVDLRYDSVITYEIQHCAHKTLRGPRGALIMCSKEYAGITVSKSCIPFDPEKPWITSGIRIGTPAMTTRGMQESEALQLVGYIDEVIKKHADEATLNFIRDKVAALCNHFPIYQDECLSAR